MTMMSDNLKKCSVCGMTRKQPYLYGPSAFGSPDLEIWLYGLGTGVYLPSKFV
jgi:hypothetical protein